MEAAPVSLSLPSLSARLSDSLVGAGPPIGVRPVAVPLHPWLRGHEPSVCGRKFAGWPKREATNRVENSGKGARRYRSGPTKELAGTRLRVRSNVRESNHQSCRR